MSTSIIQFTSIFTTNMIEKTMLLKQVKKKESLFSISEQKKKNEETNSH
jgi:hypothetical protein